MDNTRYLLCTKPHWYVGTDEKGLLETTNPHTADVFIGFDKAFNTAGNLSEMLGGRPIFLCREDKVLTSARIVLTDIEAFEEQFPAPPMELLAGEE